MSKLIIVITDDNDEVVVKAEGDTDIDDKPTPAQILTNKMMEFAGKELDEL